MCVYYGKRKKNAKIEKNEKKKCVCVCVCVCLLRKLGSKKRVCVCVSEEIVPTLPHDTHDTEDDFEFRGIC